jgi:hypothetical protein
MQILSLLLTIVGAVLGLIGALISNLLIGVIGTFLTIIGAVSQYYVGRPFIKKFTENDWNKLGDREYQFSIPASRHLRGQGAAAKVYMANNESYEVVDCEEVEERDGSFTIRYCTVFG